MKKLANWLLSALFSRILPSLRKWLLPIFPLSMKEKGAVIVYYGYPEQKNVMRLVHQVKKETEMLLSDNEAYQIFVTAKRTQKVPGEIAEVGVYKGGSAKLICEAKGNKSLYLFDTFEGIPEINKIDTLFHKGQFVAPFEQVKHYLEGYPKVSLYKGFFPLTAGSIEDKRFSFVNLDVDIYESTKNCLEFFYPRMNNGGVILSHDFIYSAGVTKAFEDFFSDKPEPIIELSGSHCLIVKI